MKKLLFILSLAIVSISGICQTYNPILHTVTNKAIGFGQQTPADARTMFFDATNFVYRPYQNPTEVLTYLNLAKYRYGNFIAIVDSGGTLNGNGTYTNPHNTFYMFADGVADLNLIKLNLFGGSSGSCVGCLLAANNLSDVSNVATARTNLGLGSMAILSSTAGGDLTGTWPNVTVAKFNGLTPSYYLNYLNLSNTPTIPAQFNPIAGSNITLSGTYPNITFSVSGSGVGFNTAGVYLVASGGGNTINLDTANYRKVDSLYSVNDSVVNYVLNGVTHSLSIRGGTGSGGGGGSGTVTIVSVVTANGISGTVANPTSTPAITLTLGNITPTTVNGLTFAALSTGFTISGGTASRTLTVSGNANVSGTNTGDVSLAGENYLSITGQVITAASVNVSGTNITGILKATAFPAMIGDVTNTSGSLATTISNSAVTFAKFQNISTAVLLGRYTTGTGVMQQITLGSGLSLNTSTGVLTAAGGVSSVGLTMPTGFTVTGSPVTSSGTLAVTTTLNGIVNANGSAFSTVTISAPITYSSGFLGVDTSKGTNSVATWYQVSHNPVDIPLILVGSGIQHMYTSVGGDTVYQEAFKNSTTVGFVKNSDSSISANNLISFSSSLSLSGATATLVNDNATPGNFKIYMTGSGGTKGWADYTTIPVGTPSAPGLLSVADKRRLDSTTYIANDRVGTATDSLGFFRNDSVYLKGIAIRGSGVTRQVTQDSMVWTISSGGSQNIDDVLSLGGPFTAARNINTSSFGLTINGSVPTLFNTGINTAGFYQGFLRKTSNYTLTASDNFIEADPTSGNLTMTLPASSPAGGEGQTYTIKKADNGSNTVTIVVSGGGTIDGSSSYVLTAAQQPVTVISRGNGNYDVLAATGTGGGGFSNPMTSVGDLILGGTSGTATRLGIGTNGYALTSNGTTASWQGNFYTSITSINDSSFTLNRPNGTKDTVQINVSTGSASSGSYIPTVTNNGNSSSASADSCFYTRVGNVVHVSGHITYTVTSASIGGSVLVSLPVASNFGSKSAWGVSYTSNSGGVSPIQSITGPSSLDVFFSPTTGSGITSTTFEATYYVY